MKKLYISFPKDPLKKCTGCRACEVACSINHENACIPSLSRIKVVRYEADGENIPIVCKQCEKAPCNNSCPTKAIIKNEFTNSWIVDDELCIGCGTCVEVCPFGAIFLHPEKKVAVKCDLCNGAPQCAKHCAFNVIKFWEEKKVPVLLAKQAADDIVRG